VIGSVLLALISIGFIHLDIFRDRTLRADAHYALPAVNLTGKGGWFRLMLRIWRKGRVRWTGAKPRS
jgi:hypothetical protein